MTDFHDNSGGVILDGPFDPDAQATVTDYIDYTEYLPADLIRSLTLIRGLDERYLEAAQSVHDFTKTYGQLPDLAPDTRPDARILRKDISTQIDSAINARESAYAEACRLYDVVDRHFNRLDCIRQKLNALPKPASREPTPAPPVPAATTAKRSRPSKKGDEGPPATTRITLRLDNHENTRPGPKSRARRSGMPAAGHLAGLHPDSPIASTEHSDVEAEPKAGPSESPMELAVSPAKKEKQRRRSRTSAATQDPNHVTAISTSNALALLKPPPEDAQPGSEDMPWLRLTEWEMTKLRKKMKKNAVWQPSEVMIHRELALRGRGWEAYRAAKAKSDEEGTQFVDCDDIMNTYIPGQLIRRTEGMKDPEGTYETKLSNRGMKLNEAKKLKRENQAREQAALAAAEAELAAKQGGVVALVSSQDASLSEKPSRAATKKRSFDENSSAVVPSPPSPASAPPPQAPQEGETRVALRSSVNKRRRTSKESPTPVETSVSTSSAPATTLASTNVPVAGADDAVDARKPSPPAPPSPTGSKRSIPLTIAAAAPAIKESRTTTPPVTRPPSRRRSAAASAEPVPNITITLGGRELRRKSATPARRTPIPETATGAAAPIRRRRRPAPGIVSSGQDGGAAVSYGRRKAKPTKKRIGVREPGLPDDPQQPREGIRIDEDGVLEEIDPNEPRYCMCGDVSFGTMICCENQDCDREWFHLDCVGLSEVPSRTAKWYCPDCRVKLNKGTDGIVRNNPRR
ncbi:hypothetical protein P170DRAFT_350451 [Aspergillus steynii IBT 23096]|uniref:Chromatin modification-related protein n=1 Tax=Aspergillus steynii IBT 23096 TaxID=1392250 RepID=A0A2I2GIV7_9EURO|nr:uncharacterized protein P170DRAFT_350451 [Aspergillus steynii IBT 23096]PLB52810.1 hypothetical protein P170DRAFT_350451 [Aspergillus steynii IBT 23096]